MNQHTHTHTIWLEMKSLSATASHRPMRPLNSTHKSNSLTHIHSSQKEKKKERKKKCMPIMNHFQSYTAHEWRSRNVPPSHTHTHTYLHIHIYILGNDALPSSQQIDKSDRLFLVSSAFFLEIECVYRSISRAREEEKTRKRDNHRM